MLEENGFLCIADLDTEDGSFHSRGFDGHDGFDRRALETLALRSGFRQAHFETAFDMEKNTERGLRRHTLFLMTAVKPAGRE